MVANGRWDMRRERNSLGAAASHRREDQHPSVFHSYGGPLLVAGMLMVVWAIGVHMI